MLKAFRYSIYGILAIILVLVIVYFELISYGLMQGYGQMQLLWNTKSIEEILADEEFPDSLKTKIHLIEEIKQFAVDSLGIRESSNYTTVYDQRGKAILWIVTACPPYSLDSKEWHYGFLGNMSYKGFFDLKRAEALKATLDEEGYDTDVDEVSAWSTLGWFNDPILSSMLYRKSGSLASLIIHELTHGTIWITDEVEYNENLADFVGDHGALLFLEYKYGKKSKEYIEYQQGKIDNERFFSHIISGSKKLDSLYKSFEGKEYPEETKRELKEEMITKITQSLDTVSFLNKKRFKNYFKIRLSNSIFSLPYKKILKRNYVDYMPNNTYFTAFIRYRGQQNIFEKEFQEEYNGNFKKYLTHLKEKYGK